MIIKISQKTRTGSFCSLSVHVSLSRSCSCSPRKYASKFITECVLKSTDLLLPCWTPTYKSNGGVSEIKYMHHEHCFKCDISVPRNINTYIFIYIYIITLLQGTCSKVSGLGESMPRSNKLWTI